MDDLGRKVGFVASAFDFLHAGHVLFLQEAKSHCDYLVAALHTDPSIERPEKNRPVESVEERVIRLQGCRYVDEIRTYTTEAELHALMSEIKPDVLVMGSDWRDRPNKMKELAGIVIYHDRSKHSYSSSGVRKRAYVAETKK